jgi:hypothetical protein
VRRRRFGSSALVGVPLVALLTGCAGPTVTANQYQDKVSQTAQAMIGIIVTAQRTADLDAAGRLLPATTDTLISDAESDARSVQTTIESRQPPDSDSDRLFQKVDEPVRATTRLLTQLRTAVRRGDVSAQTSLARQLGTPLAAFHQLAASSG